MWTTHRWRGVLITVPSVSGSLLLLRLAGLLQFMELAAFDQSFRMRPTEPDDSRIVLVTIDESDIKRLGQWPMSDAVLARLITSLKQQQPNVIGLDIFRDLPVEPGHAELIKVFTSTPNLIGIETVVKTAEEEVVLPSPILKQRDQVSASDLVLDPDGRIRRSLLYLRTSDNQSILTLGTRLALTYLETKGIDRQPLNAEQTSFQLGQVIVTALQTNDGGYVGIDEGGYQILSNFPKLQNGFRRISITEVLQGRMPPDLIRDRIVLIGVTAESVESKFFTSATTSSRIAPSGVEVHALLASQLLSAALDHRPLLKVWSDPMEWLWIVGWSTIGAAIGWRSSSPRKTATRTVLLGIVLLGSAYLLFLLGWWIIIVPPLLALVGSAITSSGYLMWENLKEYAQTLEQRVEERTLELEQEIVDRTQADERNRIAREIHDTLAQAFTGILLHIRAAQELVSEETAKAHLAAVDELAQTGLAEARRSVMTLRPKLLERKTLYHALSHLATQMQASTQTQISCEINGVPYFLPADVEDNLFRIGQEALTNAVKYAQATEIRIELTYEETQCLLRVKDNGQGFEVDRMTQGFGLLGMSERAEQIEAELILQSQSGQGTEVIVIVNREPTSL
jgi:CHASE2 domain-containing sensor protein/two-component sensor histidine kinase